MIKYVDHTKAGVAPRRPKPPALTQQAVTLAAAVTAEVQAAVQGDERVTSATMAKRLRVCRACDKWVADKGRCGECWCVMGWKARFRTAKCPHPEGPKW